MASSRRAQQAHFFQQLANGHNGNQPGKGTNLNEDETSISVQIKPIPSPLAGELREASQQLSNAQKAIETITNACIRHANEITQIPLAQQKCEELKKKIAAKDAEILKQQAALDVKEQRASDEEQAAKEEVAAILLENKRLQEENKSLLTQKEVDNERQRNREVALKLEADKELYRAKDIQKEEFEAQKETLERDTKKREKEQTEKIRKLETISKKAVETIKELNVKIEAYQNQSKIAAEKYDDTCKAKESYKMEKEHLAMELESLRNEFSICSKPIEHYKVKFRSISNKLEVISNKYFGQELNSEEMEKLAVVISAADSTFSNVPFSNTETSTDLRAAHAQRVMSAALYQTVWQNFSSDITAANPKLSTFLDRIGLALGRSDRKTHGCGRAADIYRALTMRGLESLFADDVRNRDCATQEPSTSPFGCREDEFINLVLSILGQFLDYSRLSQFKTDLVKIAKDAISVWASAQSDELMFVINPALSHKNKNDWGVRAFDYDYPHAPSDHYQEVDQSALKDEINVFTLFPIISATKRVQNTKAITDPLDSPIGQDKQAWDTEVIFIHKGLGLPENSELVRKGVDEIEEERRMKLEHDELWMKKKAEKGRRKSRNNSTVETTPGLPSPIQSWMANGRSKHSTEV